MGLMDDLAAARVHVLVVGVPGFPLLRLRALAALRRRGWVEASSPADADVLLVCGTVEDPMRHAADAAWALVPAPRARRTALDAVALEGLLDSAQRVLGDRALQAGHVPAAVPDATSAATLRLGPVLTDWPAGLIVDCDRRAGVVAAAAVTRIAPRGREEDPLPADESAFVQACDRAARLLRLAGWPAEARRLGRCIDRVLAGEPAPSVLPQVRRSAARVARSALLRANLAAVPGEALHRLLVILSDAERGALGEPGVDEPIDPAALADALIGAPCDQVRLLIAAAGTDPVVAVPVVQEVLDDGLGDLSADAAGGDADGPAPQDAPADPPAADAERVQEPPPAAESLEERWRRAATEPDDD